MRLRRRMQLLFLPFVVLMLGHLLLDSYLVQERDRLRDLLDGRLNPARVALSDLLGALVDQETGERGYLITGQEAFLDSYRNGQAQADQRVTELRRLLGDDRDLLAGLQRVRSRVTAWRQLGAEFELAAKREGRHAEAAALVATGTGMRLFDQARTEIEGLQLEVRTELDNRQDRLDSARDTITQVRAGAAVVGLGVVVLGRSLLARSTRARPPTGQAGTGRRPKPGRPRATTDRPAPYRLGAVYSRATHSNGLEVRPWNARSLSTPSKASAMRTCRPTTSPPMTSWG